MNLKNLITVQSILFLLSGLATLLAPGLFSQSYGVDLNQAGFGLSRIYGVTTLMLGVITWFARSSGPSEARRAIVIGLFFGNALAVVVMILNIFTVDFGPTSWISVLLLLLLAIGFGYFLFKNPGDE